MDKKDKVLVRVYDQESQHKTFAVPNEVTCADIVVLFGKKIHGFQASQFALCVEHKGIKSYVNQLAFPYSLAKELEADTQDDKDRKTGVSKVKFYLVNAKHAAGLPIYEPTHSFNKKSNEIPRRPSQAPRKSSDSAILTKSAEAVPRRASDGSTMKSGGPNKSGDSSPRRSGEVKEILNFGSSEDSPNPSKLKNAQLSAYLFKKATAVPESVLSPVWAVFHPSSTFDPILSIFENQESTLPLDTIHLVEAKYSLQLSEGNASPFLSIIVPNKELLVFTSDTINHWYEVLHHATKTCKPQSPSLVFAQPRPAGNRGSVTPPTAVNANELLKRRTLNGLQPIAPPDPLLRDHTIIAWVNFCCSKPVVSLDSIIQELHNGAVLAALVEVLFESKVFTNKGNSEEDFKYNVALCLDVLRILGVPTSGLFAADILECKQPRILLALLWNMFFYFVAGADEPTVRERLCEWCKSFLLYVPPSKPTSSGGDGVRDSVGGGGNGQAPAMTVTDYSIALNALDAFQFHDGTVYAALLNKFSPDSIDFNAVVQQERGNRIVAVLSAAETKLCVPKGLVDSTALADERISTMYLGILYVAISDSYKWDGFLKRIRPPTFPEPKPPVPASISVLPPEPKPNFKTPIRKDSSSPNSLALTKAATTQELQQKAELSNIKLKPVAKSPPSKAPPPPSISVVSTQQLKKTEKLPALLVAEGFQSGGSVIAANVELVGEGSARVQKPAHKKKKKKKKKSTKPGAKPVPKAAPTVEPTSSESPKLSQPSGPSEPSSVPLPEPPSSEPLAPSEPSESVQSPEPLELVQPSEPSEVVQPSKSPKPLKLSEPSETSPGGLVEAGIHVCEDSPSTPSNAVVPQHHPKGLQQSITLDDATGSATMNNKNEPDCKDALDDEKDELDDGKDTLSDNSYDDSSGSDSGGDLEYSASKIFGKVQLKNIQVEFQKDMRSREGRIKEMKRWRTSNAIPHADSLGPILSREQAIKAGHYFEDADADARERYGREPSFSRPPFTLRESGSPVVVTGDTTSSSTTTEVSQLPKNDGSGADDKDVNNQKETTGEETMYSNTRSSDEAKHIPKDNCTDTTKDKAADDEATNQINYETNKDRTKSDTTNKTTSETTNKTTNETTSKITTETTTKTTNDTANNHTNKMANNLTNELPNTTNNSTNKTSTTNEIMDKTTDNPILLNSKVVEGDKGNTDSKREETAETKQVLHTQSTLVEEKNMGVEEKELKKENTGNIPEIQAMVTDDKRIKPPKVVIRVTLEGFGDTQFRSFAIDPKTVASDVCCMVAEKMKFTEIEVPEYGLFVVKNGLERLLDADEVVMTAEVSVEKFVYKRNYENEGDRDRKLYLSLHRSHPFKFQK
eukprot:Phypoly_transcript_00700.p1 GENE.Phypoly_transcript_00700~~Phypoly_transcript_00700.p1  ORF type:complete len:1398 (+),score=261.86 Phypoly_transcript_00700:104-4195(+)